MSPPRLTGGRCQCPSCGLFFTGDREFQRHRVGQFAALGEWRHSRQCLSLVELRARGWRVDARGFWMQGRSQRAPATQDGAYCERTHSPPPRAPDGRDPAAGA